MHHNTPLKGEEVKSFARSSWIIQHSGKSGKERACYPTSEMSSEKKMGKARRGTEKLITNSGRLVVGRGEL